MELQSLQGKRWFIWAIVALVAAGVGLTTYIVSSEEDVGYPTTVVHQEKEPETPKKK